jgi:hypothetical protein
MSKHEFLTSTLTPNVEVAGQSVDAKPMQYSTGSVGYNLNGKITLPNGIRLQVSGNAVVIGSKEWSA